MTVTYHLGDTRDVTATLPDGSVSLIATSPPFLALRSYLPADHPLKHAEIGSEPDPATFLDTLLALTAEWGRVLAPWGSIAVELGDTYAGSGGAGGDYGAEGMRGGQAKFTGSALMHRKNKVLREDGNRMQQGDGWPLAKSLALIPQLYAIALAYGINPLTGQPSPAGRWRVRNVIVWHRCLDIDSVVYVRTAKGDKPMRLLHIHQAMCRPNPESMYAWNGEGWTRIVASSARTADDALEITFRNGERIACTREHRWPIIGKDEPVRSDELVVGDVVPWTHLPEPDEPRVAPHLNHEVAWLAGLFLADGSFDSRDRIQISCNSADRDTTGRRLADLAAAYDGTSGWYEHAGQGATCVIRSHVLAAAIRQYVDGDNARNKHLNQRTWGRSNGFLTAFVEGYLHGDGHFDAVNNRWRLTFTDNPWLARDLRTLAARLGAELYLRRVRRPDQAGGHHVQGLPFMHRGHLRFTPPGATRYQPGQIRSIVASKRMSFIDLAVEDDPHLFALASGLLTHNSNPAVGALGDKVRPSTSYIVVATRDTKRWFDLTAVRTPSDYERTTAARVTPPGKRPNGCTDTVNPAGAPPLDCWFDTWDGSHDTWTVTTQPSSLSHYAMWPAKLAERLILSMCPAEVCVACGTPRRRVESEPTYLDALGREVAGKVWPSAIATRGAHSAKTDGNVTRTTRTTRTTGWTDCGCGAGFTPGTVLDPFAGTFTTGCVAEFHGRDAIGIDIDSRNRDLWPMRKAEVFRSLNPTHVKVLDGQMDLFGGVA